jgi:capsular polysaccharide biosynthesis protein
MQESLSLLGYDEPDYITVDDPCVTVKRLLLPSQIDPIPEHIQWLQGRMCKAVDEPKNGARIYISRRNATKRRVRNEAEVVSALRTRGFKRYVLEELSVAEQIELFADAEAVVGPHGAGFANLVYAEAPLVVELFGQKRLNTYHRLSTALGFQYEPIYAEAHGCDLVVDTTTLLERINEELN